MTTNDFPEMLERGLGRAVLYARQHDMTPYRDVILNACLHCQSFDRQLEGTRGLYMFDVINSLPDVTFYRDRILASLMAFSDESDFAGQLDYDAAQQYELATLFAQNDYEEARRIIYAKFDANPTLGQYAGAQYIVQLEADAGFEIVAARLGELLIAQEDEYQAGLLFRQLEEQISDQEADRVIECLLRNENTRIFAEVVNAERKHSYPRAEYQQQSYAELKTDIEQNTVAYGALLKWAKQASAAELIEAANDLLLQTEPQRLRHYLKLFRETPFPLAPTGLFELTRHEDYQIIAPALTALENVQSAVVRQFALDNIAQGYETGRMVSLLARNYIEGDWVLIERLTAQQIEDRETYHSLEWGVRNMLDVHPSEQAANTLLNLYEYGPCGPCREKFVRQLSSLGKLPDWMRDECRFDAYKDTRDFVESLYIGNKAFGNVDLLI